MGRGSYPRGIRVRDVKHEFRRPGVVSLSLVRAKLLTPRIGCARTMGLMDSRGSEDPARRGRVLIVDDNPGNLFVLREVLLDFDVFTAASGWEALEFLREHTIDLILLDVMMPGMDGYETARRIRNIEGHAKALIIFISAVYKDDPDIQRGYAAGGVDYFTKPYDPSILRMKVGLYASLRQRDEMIREKDDRIRELEDRLKEMEGIQMMRVRGDENPPPFQFV